MFTNLVFISPPTSQFGPSRSDNPLSHNRLEGLATGRPTIQNPGSADSGDWIYSRVGRSLTRCLHLVPRDGASFPGHETIGNKTMGLQSDRSPGRWEESPELARPLAIPRLGGSELSEI